MVFYRGLGRQRAIRERIDFCLLNTPTFAPGTPLGFRPPPLTRRLAELTTFYTFFSFQLPVADLAYVASIDAALQRGTKDFCLIQNAGHVFYGQAELSFDLEAAMERCGLITGFPRATGDTFAMDPSCLLINRRAWEKYGKPLAGDPGRGARSLPHATTNADGDLVPGSGAITVETDFGYGWNLIAASLANGMPVSAWSTPFRRWSHNFDTHGGQTAEWIVALDDPVAAGDDHEPRLQAALTFLRNTPDRAGSNRKLFVLNTEGDENIPQLRMRPGVDRAFVVASGFKANRILEAIGFHEQTEVITYDYSRAALALRKAMIETWDGVDFAAFFAAQKPRLTAEFPGVSYLPEEITSDPAALTREFHRETRDVFHSDDAWLAHWRRFKALKHHFVTADIFQPSDLEALISRHASGRTVIWISDIFNSPNAVAKMPWERRHMCFEMMTNLLARHTTADLVIGTFPIYWLPQP